MLGRHRRRWLDEVHGGIAYLLLTDVVDKVAWKLPLRRYGAVQDDMSFAKALVLSRGSLLQG
jgi:hypothetical protein